MVGKQLEDFKSNFAAGSALTTEFFSGLVQGAGAFTSALLEGQDAMQSFGDMMLQTFKKIIVQLAEAVALAAIYPHLAVALHPLALLLKAFYPAVVDFPALPKAVLLCHPASQMTGTMQGSQAAKWCCR
jgi:hypothetical protein